MDKDAVEKVLREFGYVDFKWLSGSDVVVSDWVRMKCMFGCRAYGKSGCCPPNVPSVAECRVFFENYRAIVVSHFTKRVAKPEDRFAWSRELNSSWMSVNYAKSALACARSARTQSWLGQAQRPSR
jgi:predicted metal-binding protein